MTVSSNRPDISHSAPPSVSVVMAVHNGLPYVEAALRSMMDQTLREIEIIVIDDASTDGTPEVLARLAAEDPRIRVLTNETNLKLAASLNRGLEMARAPLIARMDADDISAPNRLAVQKAYMDAHSEVVLLGASMRKIDGEGRVTHTSIRDRDADATRWLARFHMPLVHPTFLFRHDFGGRPWRYDPALEVSQDYAFCLEGLGRGAVVSLPDVLLDYREHAAAASSRRWHRQRELAREISARAMAAQLPGQVLAALAPFRAAYFDLEPADPAGIFGGLRRMLAHDAALMPRHRMWMRRQAAQLAAAALQRGRMSRGEILWAFLRAGRDFLPPLGLRYLETQRLLPRRLQARADMADAR